jgi:Transglycosylase SLT domain
MSRLPRRMPSRTDAVSTRARRRLAAAGSLAALLVSPPLMLVPHPSSTPPPASAGTAQAGPGSAFRQIVLPDLAVIEPAGMSDPATAGLRTLHGVRDVLAMDGAAITVQGHRVNVLGVDPARFRSWTPLATASNQRVWTALAGGQFVSSRPARHLLGLHNGASYPLAGASQVTLGYAGATAFGIAGIDLVVSNTASAPLGLVHNVAALISAPGMAMPALKREVRSALGNGAKLVSLRQPQLPVTPVSTGRPGNYLQLFQQSAARYCPGMSWTVLAAIGQIESGDGANNGPSSAGALGPMQFLPSTWAVWGITAFGEPGPPNIMDPYDAVPSAARYLCAAGAGTPAGLPRAIFAYNHADWYVAEVLALARQYAQVYG